MKTVGIAIPILAGVLVLASFAAPLLPLPNPNAMDLGQRLLPLLSPGHGLGTDFLGRDQLARLLAGTRTSLLVAMAATGFSLVFGTAIGVASGFLGGKTDTLLMRGTELVMAFPYLVFALAIVAVLGPGTGNALLAIAIVNVPFVARTVRGATLQLAKAPFIDAARALGASKRRMIFFHLLPNLVPTLLTTTGTTLSWMLLETAGLGFIGLGTQPPHADLGTMLSDSRRLMLVHPVAPLIPGLALFVLAAAANLLAGARK
jgi:peptide/nickel transport system permease protein